MRQQLNRRQPQAIKTINQTRSTQHRPHTHTDHNKQQLHHMRNKPLSRRRIRPYKRLRSSRIRHCTINNRWLIRRAPLRITTTRRRNPLLPRRRMGLLPRLIPLISSRSSNNLTITIKVILIRCSNSSPMDNNNNNNNNSPILPLALRAISPLILRLSLTQLLRIPRQLIKLWYNNFINSFIRF
jgi:hypothetical protein